METQFANFFRLEEGDRLSIAVHEQVPQHNHIAAMIRASNGIVVEDALAAHFCILSLAIPDVDGLANELVSKSKLAVHDYWIRDSVDARRLLPWYPYEMAPSTSPSNDNISGRLRMSEEEIEARDIHEFVVIMARYGPLFSSEDIYRHLIRKCPHRSVGSFEDLYAIHRIEIDSRISHIRSKLDASLAPNSDYHKRHLFNFGAPKKQTPPVVPVAPAPYGDSTMPIGNELEEQVAGERASMTRTGAAHEEVPYDPPNIEAGSNPRSPVINSLPKEVVLEVPDDSEAMEGVEHERLEQSQEAAMPSIPMEEIAEGSSHASSKPNGGITDEDKDALAKFLVKYPQGKATWPEHMKLFEKKYKRGGMRSAWAWRHVYKSESVQKHIQRLQKEKARQPRVDRGRARQPPQEPPASKDKGASKAQAGQRNSAPAAPKKSPVEEIADRDKDALARWIVENPKDTDSTSIAYFKKFHSQNKIGSTRPPSSWQKFENRHKHAIQDIQADIIREIKKQNITPPVKLSDEDKRKLATWMLDNPVFTDTTSYFGAFRERYRNGASKSVDAWASATMTHKFELVQLQKRLMRDRQRTHPELARGLPQVTVHLIQAGQGKGKGVDRREILGDARPRKRDLYEMVTTIYDSDEAESEEEEEEEEEESD